MSKTMQNHHAIKAFSFSWSMEEAEGASSTNLKQGTAHLRIWMVGSISLAMDYRTTMLVRRVANQPSSFMLCRRMMLSMPTISYMPSMSKMLLLYSTEKRLRSSVLQSLNRPSSIFWPSKLDRLQIMAAHFSEFPSMTDLMKLTKFLRSVSSSLITMPTSMRLIFTFSVHCRTSPRMRSSSSRLALYSDRRVSLSSSSSSKFPSSWRHFSFMYSQISPKKEVDCWVSSTRMFPPWQSAWMKLFFISISKKVVAPSLAITAFRGCLLLQKQVTGTPSTKLYMRMESRVSSQKAQGKLTCWLPMKCLLKMAKFSFSMLKSIWSISVFLREFSPTGISQAFEKREKKRLMPKRMFTSLWMYLSTQGWRTFTATFLPWQIALYT